MLESDIRRWIVQESSDRWIRAVHRFGPDMTPEPLVLDVTSSDAESISDFLRPGMPAIVLWEIRPDRLAASAQCLRQTHADFPLVLQLVADGGLAARERLMLCEFPAAIVLQQPEQLPRLRPMVQGHFASASQPVD